MIKASTMRMYDDVLREAVSYIESNRGKYHLADFCTHSHLSRRTVQRALLHHGTSWVKLVAESKKSRAVELLLYSNKSIPQIAVTLGYSNMYFTMAFRGWFGITPGQYRERYKTYAA